MAESVVNHTCPVCLSSEDIPVWGVSNCNHPLCYICCTRIRVLGDKKECPVCRNDMNQILFCKDPSQYAIVMKKNPSFVRKYQIYFQDKTAREVFYQLQKRTCVKCNDDKSEYTSMSKLKEHLRQEHGVQFCKLCLDNLDLFTSERRVYTRQELTAHFRTGDSDGACKGHPMCKFCDERFFDRESLFFHVKKNHFWCHFCENDGKLEFYPNYSVLKGHFRKEHYLCELGQCLQEQYVNAFRSKVDLQAHVAKQHSRDMGKQEAKQARQIEVGFSYSRHKGKDEVSYSGQQTARSLDERLVESTTVPPQDQIVPKEACSGHKMTKKHSMTQPTKSTKDNWPALDVPNSRTNDLTEGKMGSLATERFLYSSQAAKRKPPPGFYPTPSRSLSDPVSGPPPGFTAATHQPPGDRRQSFITDKLSNNPTKIKEFKTMCNQFLHNEITARDYYMRSQELFGDDWKYIFEDCMSGLPNEEKRSELRLLHITENAPTWPKIEEHSRPSHTLTYYSGDLQTRKSKKKSGKAHKSKIKAVPKPLPSSSQPWSQSTGNNSLAVTTLDENEYPSLSTESSGTYSTHTFWSNRVALS